jgi:hypothetical protein
LYNLSESSTTIKHNTHIKHVTKITHHPETKHVKQNYTNNKGHTTHNEYNSNPSCSKHSRAEVKDGGTTLPLPHTLSWWLFYVIN